MSGRPPRSTLFPTRRSSDLSSRRRARRRARGSIPRCPPRRAARRAPARREARRRRTRSEEHTSELQSQFHLVCRLLLEKKNNTARTANLAPKYGLIFPLLAE